MSRMSLKAALKERALEIGFDLVGTAPVTPGRDLEFAHGWVERGYAGAMRYLSNPKRFDPRAVLPGVKSVICVGLVYDTLFPFSTEVGNGQKSGVRIQDSGFGIQESEVKTQSSVAFRHGPRRTDDGPRATDNGPRTAGHGLADGTRRAWVSRYAWGRDYHEIMRRKLEELRAAIEALRSGVETRVYVDTGPIVERAFARFSGLGWMGKNTCIINEQKGSWFFLGVILTNLELDPDLPAPDRCGSCTRCLEACPTAALVEPYVMDASRCISYLTIELKGSIPRELRSDVGVNIFGCDICQDVCPWNGRPSSVASGPLLVGESAPQGRKNITQGTSPGKPGDEEALPPLSRTAEEGQRLRPAESTALREFLPMTVELPSTSSADANLPRKPTTGDGRRTIDAFSLFNPPLEALAAITEQDFRRVFRHSPIKRVGYRGWLRNLCVAMGNSGDLRFVPYLQRATAHPDPVVREHAAWALGRLQSK